jgi:hypothetical protein
MPHGMSSDAHHKTGGGKGVQEGGEAAGDMEIEGRETHPLSHRPPSAAEVGQRPSPA